VRKDDKIFLKNGRFEYRKKGKNRCILTNEGELPARKALVMDSQYICYCGLHCENCVARAKIQPHSKAYYDEMKAFGFEELVHFVPGGDSFWAVLENLAQNGVCPSCREGGGSPDCAIRICAKEKGVEMCASCDQYPCAHFDYFSENHPVLIADNAFLKEKGMDEWAKLQDERRAEGFTYE